MSGGFLQAEGLEADWTVSPPGVSAVKALEEGRADVIQSAPSQAFTTLAKGETPTAIHFARINEMDGFFITGRAPDPDIDWKRLEGAEVILFGGGQPLAMFKYACHKSGVDFAKLLEVALDVFEHFGSLKERYAYDQVCAPPLSEG
jgi:NitT/TauT family transport system substrate-binding protein